MDDAFVLDTSAILALTGNEPGADEVQACLTEAIAGRVRLHSSFVTLTEVEYITTQEEGGDVARQRLADLTALPSNGSTPTPPCAAKRRNSRPRTGFRSRTLSSRPQPGGWMPRSSTKTPSSTRSLAS